MDLGLTGKRALVTGGTRGIGAAVVETLLSEGAVVSTCARNAEEVAVMNARAEKSNLAVTARVCDVGDPDAYIAWLNESVRALGGVDLFVANVSGGAQPGEEGWISAFNVDLMATVRGCEHLLPHLAQSRGSIVIVSSISGLEGFGGPSAYGTIKAGLISYSGQLADAAGAHGVRVNAVSPGPIHVDDGFWGKVQADQPETYSAVCARHPTGRMGTTQEVANTIVFLGSDAASWVSGANLIVDGAMTKRVQF